MDDYNKEIQKQNESQTSNNLADENTYEEETAAEFVAPVDYELRSMRESRGVQETNEAGAGKVWGYIGLALAILSLFTAPLLFGIAGIVLGFIARNRGASGLGSWAIGIGALSVVISLFLAPFF
ncbi:DUF4190 domain-containing protein [Caldibacillus lycopersici]|uniref:DUF4190 domain-containing protein n=1 Tax=Perspicuibacillus lycopersici TaxID=1325689 RepID=A0AAE3ISY9_9BACI|nr:DUF4190 domain-containing protein [Perspicuibacillus lycopersici]MCU9613891.1 DUF4190 domain-containing protein [Perspicuibacillus lycopersici]